MSEVRATWIYMPQIAYLKILVMNVFRGHTQTCHRSEYQIGNECCPMCSVGSHVKTDCTDFRSTSCLPCAEGSFMNKPTGLRQCFPCRDCYRVAGLKTKTSCTTMSDKVCEPLEGYYCMDYTEDSCIMAQKHTSCQPGQYISQKGTASRDTVCSDCSAGTYSDGTFSSCQPHKQCDLLLMRPGTASTDAECSNWKVIVITVVGLLIIGILAFVVVCKKRKGCLNKKGGKTNADDRDEMVSTHSNLSQPQETTWTRVFRV